MRAAAALLLVVSLLHADETGTIEGRILDADGKPVAGWVVTAFQRAADGQLIRKTAETDAEGRYRIAQLPPGTYSVRATPKPPPEKPPASLEEAIGKAVGKAVASEIESVIGGGKHVTVAPGAVAQNDIRLPHVLVVEARVTSGGKPVVGAELHIFPVNKYGDAGMTVTTGKHEPPRSDAEGVLRLEGVKEGSYGIFCRVDEYEVLCGTFEARVREDRGPVQLPVELGTHSIRIRVLDANGRPVPEAAPSAWQRDGKRWGDAVRTRDMKPIRRGDGVYVLPYLKPGRYTPSAAVDDATVFGDAVDVGPANPAPEVVLRLEPRGTLVVRTVDARGKAVPGVQFLVCAPAGTPSYSYPTDDAGEFRLGLSARTWHVGLAGRILGWTGEPTAVEIKPDRENVVDLVVGSK